MLEIKNIKWKTVTADEMTMSSGMGSEMGLISDNIIHFDLHWNNGSKNSIFYDAETDEFAFLPSSDSKADGLLYDFGAIVSQHRNHFKTADSFIKHIDSLVEDDAFFISEV